MREAARRDKDLSARTNAVMARSRYHKNSKHPCTHGMETAGRMSNEPAFLFDLDGTLVDSVYQHVLAWREALEEAGIELAVWRIHRRVGMSGGVFVEPLLRETGREIR